MAVVFSYRPSAPRTSPAHIAGGSDAVSAAVSAAAVQRAVDPRAAQHGSWAGCCLARLLTYHVNSLAVAAGSAGVAGCAPGPGWLKRHRHRHRHRAQARACGQHALVQLVPQGIVLPHVPGAAAAAGGHAGWTRGNESAGKAASQLREPPCDCSTVHHCRTMTAGRPDAPVRLGSCQDQLLHRRQPLKCHSRIVPQLLHGGRMPAADGRWGGCRAAAASGGGTSADLHWCRRHAISAPYPPVHIWQSSKGALGLCRRASHIGRRPWDAGGPGGPTQRCCTAAPDHLRAVGIPSSSK